MTVSSYIKRPRAAVQESWGLRKLCLAYSWPSGLVGGGTIAIVELGGGWKRSDIEVCLRAEGLPAPLITDVSVDGTKNSFGVDVDSDMEVALDIEAAATAYSVATGKAADIRVYWAQDIALAVRAATKDACDVCSISWGDAESGWGLAAAQDMEAAAQSAVAAGMVVFAASGDNDADDGTSTPTVDLPAACPSVVGCGGTRLLNNNGARGLESVWNDGPSDGTGGGYSKIFPPQVWQAGVPAGPGRAVPDVSANADPETGVRVYLNGSWQIVGGTSGVAPIYAGLFASFGKKLGFVTPTLWTQHMAFNLITEGNNGYYRAGDGPRPPCGLGSPIGTKLAALFVKA